MSKKEPQAKIMEWAESCIGERGGGDWWKEGGGISQTIYVKDSWTWKKCGD